MDHEHPMTSVGRDWTLDEYVKAFREDGIVYAG